MSKLLESIRSAKTILLSTHTQPDGDGLGAQMAMYWAFKKIGKKVRILNVDKTPRKYNFLDPHNVVQTFDNLKDPMEPTDLSLIFDTNDPELLLTLWDEMKAKSKKVAFIDHHPVLEKHPLDLEENIIDIQSSSTGQICFNLIKELHIPLDSNIALPLYTSIVFDTNYFRYIRGSPTPHLITAELLSHNIDAPQVHRHLFGNHSPDKLKFLGQILGSVEYALNDRLALIKIKLDDMNALGLEMDETRDIIDMVMNVECIEAAALFREDGPDQYKLSFRTKGLFAVNLLAERLGGGGHLYAAGAQVHGHYGDIKSKVVKEFSSLFDNDRAKKKIS